MKSIIAVSTILACSIVPMAYAEDTIPLSLDTQTITVSGLSSGGYMASQFHFAHSDWVSGAALLASGPVYCAQNSITTALERCVDKVASEIPLDVINSQVATWANDGKIANTKHLEGDKVWIYHGKRDTRVNEAVTQALIKQYQTYVKPDHVVAVTDQPTPHVFPTLTNGNDCTDSTSPFIGACEYDAAGAMLTHLIGAAAPEHSKASGTLVKIDQHKLGGQPANTLAKEGYLYVPSTCEQGEVCKVHVSFHGCNQNAEAVGTAYAEQTGINRWADANETVVLYPQTKKSMFLPLNPQACWDWWGYTGADYATQEGKQITAVKNMINALSAQ